MLRTAPHLTTSTRWLSAFVPLLLVVNCTKDEAKTNRSVEPWRPEVAYPSERETIRGRYDVRGLIHAHSVYSHDACDEEPVLPDGSRNAVCLSDFRRGICQTKHDFVFLTDHGTSFNDIDFPEALLHAPELGDTLVERNGGPVANRLACDDGTEVLLMAGSENALMPVGIETHVADTAEAREAVYGQRTTEAANIERDHGAVVLLAHPEDFEVDELLALPVDGFEMYNMHANSLANVGAILDLLLRVREDVPHLAHPDLLVMQLWNEDPRYSERWGKALAAGHNVISTMGTDCHRNTFPQILADGERLDSYRRTMKSFSNHLRVTPLDDGTIDDVVLKEALAAGRNYGVFEVYGYPVGYDAYGEKDDATFEMGERVPVGATLHVQAPTVKNIDAKAVAPELVLRVLKAENTSDGFVEVAQTSDARLQVPLTEAGAYRVEVRILPHHLRDALQDDVYLLLDDVEARGDSYVWIYGGTFYVE